MSGPIAYRHGPTGRGSPQHRIEEQKRKFSLAYRRASIGKNCLRAAGCNQISRLVENLKSHTISSVDDARQFRHQFSEIMLADPIHIYAESDETLQDRF